MELSENYTLTITGDPTAVDQETITGTLTVDRHIWFTQKDGTVVDKDLTWTLDINGTGAIAPPCPPPPPPGGGTPPPPPPGGEPRLLRPPAVVTVEHLLRLLPVADARLLPVVDRVVTVEHLRLPRRLLVVGPVDPVDLDPAEPAVMVETPDVLKNYRNCPGKGRGFFMLKVLMMVFEVPYPI